MAQLSWSTLLLASLALVTALLPACKKASDPAAGAGGTDGGSTAATSGGLPSTSPSSSPGPSATAPGAVPIVDVTNETLSFGGAPRIYLLAKPKNYDATKSYPLVVSFHGNPGTAADQAHGLPFESASGSDAIIAYPQAASADSGAFSWDLYTPTATNADMDFIKALIAEIKANNANIDTTKVLGFGYSGGGFFVSQYACRFGGVFKAISVNAGGGPDEEQMGFPKRDDGCYICPGGPIATIVTHGANDTEVTPDSGEFTAACYADENGCAATRTATTPAPCELEDSCPADKPVKRCIIDGLGHGPWDGAMREAWAFFKALP